jgi:Zn-dependent protease
LKCEACGKEEALPFVCNYCRGVFCADHRLPESHNCKGNLTKKPVIVTQARTSSWDGTSYTSSAGSGRTIFSPVEVRDIILAWLALGLAFFLSTHGGAIFVAQLSVRGLSAIALLESLGVSLLTVGTGFVLHELMHKFTAERYGFWAEFRAWPYGILLALITSMVGFIFAAPGATYISGSTISTRENGIISLAGPVTNVIVGVLFLPFLLYGQGILGDLGRIGFNVNTFLALFNMLPILPLDGAKVFGWNKVAWGIVFFPLLILLVYNFLP